MVEQGVTVDWINDLPWSIALPLWDAVRMGRKAPSMTWPLQVYILIDRLDIAAQLDLGHRSVSIEPSVPHQNNVSSSCCPCWPCESESHNLLLSTGPAGEVRFQRDPVASHPAIGISDRIRCSARQTQKSQFIGSELPLPKRSTIMGRGVLVANDAVPSSQARGQATSIVSRLCTFALLRLGLISASTQRGRAPSPAPNSRTQLRISHHISGHWLWPVHLGFESPLAHGSIRHSKHKCGRSATAFYDHNLSRVQGRKLDVAGLSSRGCSWAVDQTRQRCCQFILDLL